MPQLFATRAGMVSVGMAAAIAGALAGPPAVSFAVKAAQDVFITNSPSNPVPIAGSVTVQGRTPFQATGIIGKTAGEPGTSPGSKTHVPLPEGKALIVEFVSAGGVDFEEFAVHSGGPSLEQLYRLPLTFRESATDVGTVGSERTHFRLDDDLYLFSGLRPGSGNSVAQWIVAGYLVDE